MTPANRRVREPEWAAQAREASALPSTPSPDRPRAPTRLSRALSALRTAAGIVVVAAASCGVAWTARKHVMTSPRFAITDIDVTGNAQRARDALVAEADLTPGVNVFSVDLEAARAKLLADPWIADATIARRLPGTILVRVTERKAAALVALGTVYLTTAEGEPFKALEPGDPIDLPLVTGLQPEDLADDREGAVRTIRRAIDLAYEYGQAALGKRAALEEAHVGADGTFSLVIGKDATELRLGGPPFRRKLDQAARVVAELEKRNARADTIMLDNEARPDRVVVRIR